MNSYITHQAQDCRLREHVELLQHQCGRFRLLVIILSVLSFTFDLALMQEHFQLCIEILHLRDFPDVQYLEKR